MGALGLVDIGGVEAGHLPGWSSGRFGHSKQRGALELLNSKLSSRLTVPGLEGFYSFFPWSVLTEELDNLRLKVTICLLDGDIIGLDSKPDNQLC